MSYRNRTITLSVSLLTLAAANVVRAQDWPQWRGANRDAKVTGFTAPASWPKELTRKWKVEVGDGVATPSLVDGKLYVFARQDGNEIIRCLDATTGKEHWQDKYQADAVSGPHRGFPGPRSSPTVADGKVVTLGVQGTLSCYVADTGKRLWRNDDFKGSVPRFATSSSPIVVDGLCIAQIGESDGGSVVAYVLATGKEKWKWEGDGPAYGSPVLANVGGTKAIIAPTNGNMVALDAAEGKVLWQLPYKQGRYNAATPLVDGQTLVYAGPTRGMTAQKLVKKGKEISVEKLWINTDNSVQFNTPVLKDGLLFGLSTTDSLFCINSESGETAWSAPLNQATSGSGSERDQSRVGRQREGAGGQRQGGRRGRGRGRRGGGRGGYGSIVDAGSALFALTPAGQLTVFEPTKEKLNRLASYKVAEGKTYAYPVISGNRILIKDGDSVILWAIE